MCNDISPSCLSLQAALMSKSAQGDKAKRRVDNAVSQSLVGSTVYTDLSVKVTSGDYR